ncbi:MAG: hypothetical protein COB37_00860 [Kordiimonadales bacterium]|nr:MAG: hypothetical protein COB37_00860 [Kordiimonadales bacterium]
MTVRALIVDDETMIAEDMALQLAARPGWEARFCCDPSLVLDLITRHNINVCFLDIEMPGQSGIALSQQLRSDFPSVIIIFATAFAEHAATAYRLPATDYLVKPISDTVLDEACVRVEQQLKAAGSKAIDPTAGMIAVKSMGRTDYIKTSEIVMGQAAGNYVCLHSKNKEYLHRASFGELSDQLAPHGFLKCHRSYFVNASKVVSFVRNIKDGDELVLEGGYRAPVSQAHRKSVNMILSSSEMQG